ncbi:alpha,alpha-trehalose-phosphate synthase (UDP-forming) [Tranquillimonas rosea]|uniref:alpha,alpha-trehalose-phosphate synthase (UDP-forming) n=1 Tax=Tranquillimonas rosea TaxID=641238 RepID=UPI003BA9A9AE
MSERVIVVSNRVPTEEVPSGGLVVALHDCLSARGGLWLGAHPEPSEDADGGLVELPGGDGYEKAAFRLTPEEYEDYYLGYANSVLWPLCHRRTDLIALDRRYAEAYERVNRRVARHLAEMLTPDDLIWIHDYHFLPLARYLRELGVTNRIGFFLHIPFPALGDVTALPEREALHDWVVAFDVFGVQTRADVARGLEMFRAHQAGELMLDGRVKFRGDTVDIRSFPIGIDVEAFAGAAQAGGGRRLAGLGENEDLVIGVDRLDYSKGIPNRVTAFGQYLDRLGPDSRRATLLQIAPPSRSSVTAYQEITRQLEYLAGSLNGDHAELDWTPIRYIHRGVPRDTLARLYRAARVGMVTPLADGMNLVAKEYVAAQDPEDPGVLILSATAGAAESMTDALIVNAYDTLEMAEALERALSMPLAERQDRHRRLLTTVRETHIAGWSQNFLSCLRQAEPAMPRVAMAG